MTFFTEIHEAQHGNRARAERAVEVAGRFAGIVTGRTIESKLVPGRTVAPAWSTASGVFFGAESIEGNLHTPEGVLSMRGLTCHEVAHILYTPRAGAKITRWVIEHGLFSYYNILEDARIERMLVGRYNNAVVPWLTATIAQHILGTPDSVTRAFPLIHGRKYLPLDVRQAVREAYEAPEKVQVLADILDEYVTLVYPRDFARGCELIQQFADNLPKQDEQGNRGEGYPEGGCVSEPSAGAEDERPATQREQESDQAKAGKRGDINDDLASGNPGAGQPDVQGEGKSSGTPSNTNSDAPTPPSSGEGTGKSASSTGDVKERVLDGLEKLLENIQKTHARDIKRTIADYNGETYDDELDYNGTDTPAKSNWKSVPLIPTARRISDELAQELQEIQTAHDPGWEREVASGRVSATRYLRGCDIDEAFDRWNPGNDDAVDIECVIALDCSGSMEGEPVVLASQSVWGLKTALDSVGANTTVVAYGTSTRLLYSADERTEGEARLPEMLGGTYPKQALAYASDVFATSQRAVKILLNVTDGRWSYEDECNALVADMRDAGVLTGLAYIDPDNYKRELDRHESEVGVQIQNAGDLLPLGRELVNIAIERGLTR